MSCSVVIPTLGGATLKNTISLLNEGSIVPSEILVCIPQEQAFKKDDFEFSNVKIIKTERRGQVAQRIEGFKNASCPYVMQLDDDINVDVNCIKYLLDVIELRGPNVAVAPALIDMSTNESVYKKPAKPTCISTFYYWLMNGVSGYQPGKVDKTGTPVGFNTKSTNIELIESEWLAGGCVMHHRDNLILNNYFPFEGKAFGEDVIQSFRLTKKGIKLFIATKAVCSLEIIPISAYTFSEYLINLKSEVVIRKYYMKLMSRDSFRIDIYYFISIIRYVIKKYIFK